MVGSAVVGDRVGEADGLYVGDRVGLMEGLVVGLTVGEPEGDSVGSGVTHSPHVLGQFTLLVP